MFQVLCRDVATIPTNFRYLLLCIMYHINAYMGLYRKKSIWASFSSDWGARPSDSNFPYAGEVRIGNCVYYITGLDKFWGGTKHVQAPLLSDWGGGAENWLFSGNFTIFDTFPAKMTMYRKIAHLWHFSCQIGFHKMLLLTTFVHFLSKLNIFWEFLTSLRFLTLFSTNWPFSGNLILFTIYYFSLILPLMQITVFVTHKLMQITLFWYR